MLPMWVTAALAAVLVGSMLHLNSLMASLGAQVQQLDARFDRLTASLGAQVQQMEARMVVRYDGLDARFDRLTASVDGLLVSTLTPAAAQATLACAQASVYILFLFTYTWNHTLGELKPQFKPCSAFAYAKLKGGDTLVVSAAHCFTNFTQTTIDATRLALARESRVTCWLLKSLPTSDSAVLRCADAPPLLRRTASAPVFAQAVVAAGFFQTFYDPDFPPPLSVHDNFAMHVLTSTIAVSMGPGAATLAASGGGLSGGGLFGGGLSGGGLSGGGLSLPTRTQPPFGVLQGKALQGMSGGPVLDVHCGVVGIISRLTTNTAFGSLDEVDAWALAEAWV
jgi:uncharacterized membrane protein YgcG